ncbi:PTS sugar transporter subunit IIB [Staphylococcus lentus]|uniref:PTS sugar transporter subunit IIB n=1 Tax=Mammaliicoccus lentus TaxID=42858 RepID=UPI0018842058|nr:PTS sugar transporter subunit IIB [Mammaliicoccus lentus]MBF0840394.1 PTS sugar transporter subunit IIB [Mammaliicoccus lentus]
MNKKIVYICCGTGVATSTVIAKKVRKLLEDNGVNSEISQWKVSEVTSQVKIKRPDIIISSADISGDVGDVPVVSGRPFLTGIKKEMANTEVLEVLSN